MIDLVLWASTRADFAAFAKAHPPGDPLMDDEGNFRAGIDYCWWAGSGKLMTAKGEYDEDGTEITAPTFLPGFVALVRLHAEFFEDDKLDPRDDDTDKDENWSRSKVARYVKNNGSAGTVAGSITYYALDGVRLFRPVDVFGWLASRGLPGHEWQGGNAL